MLRETLFWIFDPETRNIFRSLMIIIYTHTTHIALSLLFFMISFVSLTFGFESDLDDGNTEAEVSDDTIFFSCPPWRGHLGSGGGGCVGWAGTGGGVKFSWMFGAEWWCSWS